MTVKNLRLDLSKAIIERYSSRLVTEDEHLIGALIDLMQRARSPIHSATTMIPEIAKLIHRYFEFREVAIALRDKKDGLYRYKVCIGFRDDAENARYKLAYTLFDLTDMKTFPGILVRKKTFFHLMENKPFREGEEETYNRPSLLGMERKNQDEMIEGDYIDSYFYGPNKDPLGWIELSGPRNSKFPSRRTVNWIELTAKIIAAILIERELVKKEASR